MRRQLWTAVLLALGLLIPAGVWIQETSLSRHPAGAGLQSEGRAPDLGWLRVKQIARMRTESGTSAVRLSPNFVAEDCDRYPGGVGELAGLMEKGLRRGLACMWKQEGRARADAERIVNLLRTQSARIRCLKTGGVAFRVNEIPLRLEANTFAMATLPGEESYPLVAVNMDASVRMRRIDLEQNLFHEVIHWLGHPHGGGFDVAYLASICCFTERSEACELLRDSPDWTSVDYHSRFARVMALEHHSDIAIEAAWNSVGAASILPVASVRRHGARSLFAAVHALAGVHRGLQSDEERLGVFMALTALAHSTRDFFPAWESARRKAQFENLFLTQFPDSAEGRSRLELALALGDLLATLHVEDGPAFWRSWEHQWKAFSAIRRRVCPLLSSLEKERLTLASFSAAGTLSKRITEERIKPELMARYQKALLKPCP